MSKARDLIARRREERLQATPEPPPRPKGRPHNYARNDRLLELFEATPETLTKIHRCRIAGRMLAEEVAAKWGHTSRVRTLAATTVRDAIQEARNRRNAADVLTLPLDLDD